MDNLRRYSLIHNTTLFYGWQRYICLMLVVLLLAASTPLFSPTSAIAATTNTPSFTSRFFSGADETQDLAVGDLNSDGFLDIIKGNNGEQSAVYLNDGNGNFPIAHRFSAVFNTLSVAVGDLNGDGFLDIVQGNSGQPSMVYLNDGTGSFSITRAFGIANTTTGLATGDLNGDGFLDIVQGNSGQPSIVYLNDGTGKFPTVLPFGSASSTQSVAVGDLNGDNIPDIVTANIDEQNAVYLNDGNGNFPTARPFTRIDTTTDVSLGDLDGDGTLDIVFANDSAPGLVAYLNDGVANFPNNLIGADKTQSLALGDVDGNGTLDIALGGIPGLVLGGITGRIYLNDGEGAFLKILSFQNAEYALSLKLADFNNDGAIDIANGNLGQSSVININNGVRSFTTVHRFGDANANTRMAVGDFNGDDLLDIVQGGRPSAVYLNDGGGNFPTPDPFGSPTTTEDVAVGDLNGDGFLDIIQGNTGQPSVVYLNDGTSNFPTAKPFGGVDDTTSVVVGDLNNDGALDIVVGIDGRNGPPSKVYLNDGIGNFQIAQSFGSGLFINAIALGDLNSDGALDIVAANRTGDQPGIIYLNDGKGNFPSTQPFGNSRGSWDVAVGDLNSDGALDIVTSGYGVPSAVYFNNGKGDFSTGRPFGNANNTLSLALGDFNGDRMLDIVAGRFGGQDTLYLNNGAGDFPTSSAFSVSNIDDATGKLVVGDLNNDGALDIVAGNDFASNAVYLNGIAQTQRLPNNAPTISIIRPGPVRNASFYSTPTIIDNQVIPIHYTLSDHDDDPVRAISATYSLDGGGSWRTAVPTNTVTTDLATSPTGINYTFNWDTFASGFFGQSDNVVFRIIVYPSVKPTKNGVAGPYQRPYTSATTFPFRVRGSQVRVLENNAPVPNALVYRLPKDQTGQAQPIAAQLATLPFTTDAQGYLRGRGQINIGDQLIALAPISTTTAFSTTYNLYHTNMVSTITGTVGFTVAKPGVQQIDVSAAHPLALFPLDISLEWDAHKDTEFLTQLQSDLARTSEFLFNASNGQAALGEVRIFQDKLWWDQVNLRIYASNRLRPNAVIGGAITQPITDPVSIEANTPPESALVYGPGQLRMGAVWNRFGNASGNLSEDWPRTLAHELSHYLLFLQDNYVGTNDTGTITSIPTCPGIMSDPYASNSKFHPETDWLPGCERTLSNRETQRSDWATINTFYPLVAPTVKLEDLFPSNLPLAVTHITPYTPITPTQTLDVPIFYLINPDGSAYQPSTRARGYLFQENPGDPSGAATRLTALGQANQDQVQARGAKIGDRVCVIEPAAQRPTAIQGCTEVKQGQERITLTSTPNWPPDVVVTPVTSTTLELTITGAPTDVATKGLLAQLFPGDNLPATAPIALTQSPDKAYHGTITLDQSVEAAQIRIWVNEPITPLRRESITDLAIGGNPGTVLTGGGFARTGGGFARTGGGFARTGGGFARTGGGFARTGGAPVSTAEGDVLLVGENLTFQTGQFLALQTTSALPQPPSWATVIGNAYRFTASANKPDLSNTSLSFNYLGSDVPAGEEQGVQVYFWDEKALKPQWQRLPTTINTYYHIASVHNQGPGLYALMSSVQIVLQGPGWNIFADPVAGTRLVAETLASINGAYTTVYGYTVNDKDYPWKVYDVDAPDWVNTLRDLTFGKGYWIHATEAITLYLKGNTGTITSTAALQSIQAESLPTPPATYYGAVPVATSKAGLTVQATVNGTVCGQTQTQQHPIRGQMYESYAITVSAADASDHIGCGVPGQPMTVSFFDGTQEIAQIKTAWDNSHVIELRPSTVRLPIISSLNGSGPITDLAVVDLDVQPSAPRVGQATELKVTIRNIGTTDITAPFWIDLYIDPRTPPQVNQIWPQLTDYGVSWRVYGLKAGATLTLSSRVPNDPLKPGTNYSNFTTFVRNGVHQVYVLADSYAPGIPTGAVGEDNEHNNLIGPMGITVGGSQTTAQPATTQVDRRP